MNEKIKTYLPWFILKEIPGIGNHLYKILIQHFKEPENVLNASKIQLQKINNIQPEIINSIINHKKFKANALKEIELLIKFNIKVLVFNDTSYPELLKQIPDPPAIITYQGELENVEPCISIVGSRNATSYGLNSAEKLSFDLCSKGFVVVSGMARGIDSAAHLGALKSSGKTIAVLGSGLNKIYPKENINLFNRIKNNGAVISELKFNAEPKPYHFPMRNRIIAGMSTGTVVVEAAKRSGSLITARLSAEYNREVFAVPGSIKSQKSAGTHAMLKDGAKLVENEMDIIDELHHFIREKKTINTINKKKKVKNFQSQSEKNKNYHDYILNILEPYPMHIDKIIQTSNLDTSLVTTALLELELQGRIIHSQGNYFCISEE